MTQDELEILLNKAYDEGVKYTVNQINKAVRDNPYNVYLHMRRERIKDILKMGETK